MSRWATTVHFLSATSRAVARLLRRLVARSRRGSDEVADEYDAGHWRRVLEAAEWETAADLESFLAGPDRSRIVVKLDGAIVRMSKDDYYRWRLRKVQEVVAKAAGDETQLVELGSGFGYNLFSLALDPRWTSLRGHDISPNAVLAGTRIAEHFGLAQVSFGSIDLTDPSDPAWATLEGATAFTYLCLEQLPRHVEVVLRTAAAARPRRVIHVESAAGLLSPWRPFDWLNRLYARSMDYQSDLVPVLRRLEAEGVLSIVSIERLRFGSLTHNDPLVATWEPRH